MRRFGSVFPFVEAGREERHIGRLVANHDFARALLRYADFDEFIFSSPSISNLRHFQQIVESWGLAGARLDQIRYVSFFDLPSLLRTTDFQVFHLGGWSRMMAGLHYVRARYAPVPWPITAVTHSLNGREVVDHAVALAHARLEPHDAIFCTSRDGSEVMRRLLHHAETMVGRRFAGQLIHLPLGIDDRLLERPGSRGPWRARLGLSDETVALLVLGRITPASKMDLGPLFRALETRILPAATPPVTVLVAGAASPHDLSLVRGQVTLHRLDAHVRLLPDFAEAEKPNLLAASDILVSPVDNAQETFGLSILEGMAAGLPVVASRFDGYKDLVEDGVDGFLVDTWWSSCDPVGERADLMDRDTAQLIQSQSVAVDLEQLSARLLHLIHDAGARQAMGRAARRKVEREYAWSRVIPRYEREWNRLRLASDGVLQPSTGANPFALSQPVLFSGYASRELTPSTRLRATTIVADEAPYDEVAPLLKPDVLARIIDAAAEGSTVETLVAASGVAEAEAWFAIQWLLKYGLLRGEEGREAPGVGTE